MRARHILAIGLLASVACKDGVNSESPASKNSSGAGIAVSGMVYGFTAAPDSQRFALEGATVTLARIGDLPSTGPGQGPDTTLVNRQGGLTMLLDSVIPPNEPPPPPPSACDEGTAAGNVVTGADGSWGAAGLEEGLYRVRVTPPANSGWSEVEACGYEVRQGSIEPLVLYLPRTSGT